MKIFLLFFLLFYSLFKLAFKMLSVFVIAATWLLCTLIVIVIPANKAPNSLKGANAQPAPGA